MRALPRLSASQAVNNFHDIDSNHPQSNKYRHVSQKDFYAGQNNTSRVRRKTFNGGADARANMMEEMQNKIAASSELLEGHHGAVATSGYSSSRTPVAVNMSDRRKIAAGFDASGLNQGRTFTMNEVRAPKDTMTSENMANCDT